MFTVRPYNNIDCELWNDFVAKSGNATFLLNRNYMDYHKDRFTDASLIIVNNNNDISALFAASKSGDIVSAHGGLTYGGFILPVNTSVTNVLEMMNSVLAYYSGLGTTKLIYKSIPHIYHKIPCEEDVYALFRFGAKIEECNVSSVISYNNGIGFNYNSRRNLKKAVDSGIVVDESGDFDTYWKILETVLREKHNASPVHSLNEIKLLRNTFTVNIKLYLAFENNMCVAGVILYVTDTVAHCQYIASSERGREVGALAAIFNYLIPLYKTKGVQYFDFGTSNENHGLVLNEGLIRQKNGFGGRAVTYVTYSIDM